MSALNIYNTLTRKKELFEPLRPGCVGMYVCGVTVYDLCHVGHARVMVVFDVIYRWLRHSGYDVSYVRNFTDVDDKIIKRANERGVDVGALTDEMIEAFHVDVDRLNCLRPMLEPRATVHMGEMIAMIEQLLDKGYAYVADSGDVLFEVRKFAAYGRLSGKNIDDLESGARVEVDASKRDPLDFALWKRAKPDEPAWDSPWGAGRPGWHIECSAMSCRHLGDTFDIHGGGMDLTFPHHENEIAQARCANGGGFARYWLHNGFVNINEEKMSKSLGNFFTICEVLKQYHPEVLRMFILGTHYRSPLDFSDAALDVAKNGLDRLYETKRRLGLCDEQASSPSLPDGFSDAMNDDFNTPEALAALFDLGHRINKSLDTDMDAVTLAGAFYAMCGVLGIVQQEAGAWFQAVGEDVDVSGIEALIAERLAARKGRDFARADAIRDELSAMGILLEDGPAGTTWKRK
ncbi:MAG: cysteine--tRNA ligase [Mariprofundaceae bacterium]